MQSRSTTIASLLGMALVFALAGTSCATSSSAESDESSSSSSASETESESDSASNSKSLETICEEDVLACQKTATKRFEKAIEGCEAPGDAWNEYGDYMWEGGGVESESEAVRKNARKNLGIAAAKLYECDAVEMAMTEVAHLGNGPNALGISVFAYLDEEAGVDIQKMFLEFLKAQGDEPLTTRSGVAVAKHFTRYLIDREQFDRCGKYEPHLQKEAMPDESFQVFARFWAEAECKGVAETVASRLTSDRAETRRILCEVLADVGTKEQLEKVQTLAETDGAVVRRRGTKVYPVRDACREAAGQIKMRQ